MTSLKVFLPFIAGRFTPKKVDIHLLKGMTQADLNLNTCTQEHLILPASNWKLCGLSSYIVTAFMEFVHKCDFLWHVHHDLL